eukprot:TRINITY_DN13736_c0_g1_i1.p1 TRINITY_DN13736_c0_g1~~TRINITY_DN13736_c0_g1_i1.p1  ORF type:complete len:909 (+),score=204.71 TRINITY_DN13736_c0_g1_i1:258-2729(+)
MGKVVLPVSSIKSTKTEKWYHIYDDYGNQVDEAEILISTRLQISNKKKAVDEKGILGLLIANLKPIINNIFVVLFRAIKPLMGFLLSVRKIVMDWESPVDAFTYSVMFYIVWWNSWFFNFILACLLWGMAKRYILYTYSGKHYITYHELQPKEMLLLYKTTKIELKYGRNPHISEDFDTVFRVTKILGDIANLSANYYNWQNPHSWKFLSAIILIFFVWNFVPLYLILSYVIYYGLLLGWLFISIVLPLKFHFTNAYFYIIDKIFVSHIEKWEKTTSKGRLIEMKERDIKFLSQCPGVERKSFKKGEFIEKTTNWGDKFFYVDRGQILQGNKGHIEGSWIMPQNILNKSEKSFTMSNNLLTKIVAIKNSSVYIFPVDLIKIHLSQNPILSSRFFRYIAFNTVQQWFDIVLSHYIAKKKLRTESQESLSTKELSHSDISKYLNLLPEENVIRSFSGVYTKNGIKKRYGTLVITNRHIAFLSTEGNAKWLIPYSSMLGVLRTENRFKIGWKLKNNVSKIFFWVVNLNYLTIIEEVLNDIISVSKNNLSQKNRHKFGKGVKVLRSSQMLEFAQEAMSHTSKIGGNLLTPRNHSSKEEVFKNKSNDDIYLDSGSEKLSSQTESGSILFNSSDSQILSNNSTTPTPSLAHAHNKSDTLLRFNSGGKNFPFNGLELEFLTTQKKFSKNYKKGNYIYQSHESRNIEVLFMYKGSCQLMLEKSNDDDDDEFIDSISEGCFFGAESLILEKTNSHLFAKALEDCIVYFLPGWYLKQCFRQVPSFASTFYQYISEKYFENFMLLKQQMVDSFSLKLKHSSHEGINIIKENIKI